MVAVPHIQRIQHTQRIRTKVLANERITDEDGLYLLERACLADLQDMAAVVRKRHNGNMVYFNKNIHIEPTNIFVNGCLF
jgi:aminodeoxyfutalosine synthase